MTISNEKLRLFAVRAVRALEKHKQAHPVIQAYESTLVPASTRFCEAFDAFSNFTPVRVERMESRHDKATQLHKLMRTWSGVLAEAIASYDANKLFGAPNNPDPLLDDARRLLTLVAEQGDRLVNRDVFTRELTELLAAASEERESSLRVRTQHEQMEAIATQHHVAFERVFKRFHGTLGVVLGKGHLDYQELVLRPKRKHKDAPKPDVDVANENAETITNAA
jgi:hypothetical protein